MRLSEAYQTAAERLRETGASVSPMNDEPADNPQEEDADMLGSLFGAGERSSLGKILPDIAGLSRNVLQAQMR